MLATIIVQMVIVLLPLAVPRQIVMIMVMMKDVMTLVGTLKD
jgi:hypothetical protein